MLLIYPLKEKISKITEKLNKIEKKIQFTYEDETNKTIPYLDILLH